MQCVHVYCVSSWIIMCEHMQLQFPVNRAILREDRRQSLTTGNSVISLKPTVFLTKATCWISSTSLNKLNTTEYPARAAYWDLPVNEYAFMYLIYWKFVLRCFLWAFSESGYYVKQLLASPVLWINERQTDFPCLMQQRNSVTHLTNTVCQTGVSRISANKALCSYIHSINRNDTVRTLITCYPAQLLAAVPLWVLLRIQTHTHRSIALMHTHFFEVNRLSHTHTHTHCTHRFTVNQIWYQVKRLHSRWWKQ